MIWYWFLRLWLLFIRSKKACKIVFEYVDPISHIRSRTTMLTLSDIQQSSLTVSIVDAKNNPAVLAGIPVWTVSDSTILTIVPAADGLSAILTAVGPLGTAKVSSAIGSISGSVDVTVIGSAPAQLVISAATPTDVAAVVTVAVSASSAAGSGSAT
jgi:hypothetical protein